MEPLEDVQCADAALVRRTEIRQVDKPLGLAVWQLHDHLYMPRPAVPTVLHADIENNCELGFEKPDVINVSQTEKKWYGVH